VGKKILQQFQSVPADFWRAGEQPKAKTVKELQQILARIDPATPLKMGEADGVQVAIVGFGTDTLAADFRELFD
jgi:hypothetical protein